jgi:genome maintenance exonuclease 1
MTRFNTIGLPKEPVQLTRRMKGTQRWYTTPEGNEYPSVTTVLGHGDKPWLENWRNMLGDKKAQRETERCAERGTAVHEMAEAYLKNDENPTKGYRADHAKLFNQIKLRLNKIDNILAQEVALYSDSLKLAGTVDCVAEYEGQLSIIDFKTSNNNKDVDMVNDYFLQCTAYSIAFMEMYDIMIDDIVVLIAVEKGMMPMVYKKKIDEFVEPLTQRINTFYSDMKGKA